MSAVWSFSIKYHLLKEVDSGVVPADKRWGLFCRYNDNPLQSNWAFCETEGDCKRLRSKLANDLEKRGVSYEII
jgi:hypothetical protein